MTDKQQEEKVAEMINTGDKSAPQTTVDMDKPDLPESKLKELLDSLSEYKHESVQKALEKFVQAEVYDKSYPKPFIMRDGELTKKAAQDHAYWNFKIRVLRVVAIISMASTLLIVATYRTVAMSTILGIGLLIMFTVYFSIIFRYVFSCKDGIELYRIYSMSQKPERWLSLKTGHLQYLYVEESIQSISELSAINGGVTKTMLNTLGAYTWTAVMCHFAAELYYNRCIFSWDIVDLFEIIGTAGLLLISVFELDPVSPKMQTAHYIGAAMGCGTVVGFVIQQWHFGGANMVISMAIAVIAGIAFVLWQLTGFWTDAAQQESKRKSNPDFKLHGQWLLPRCVKEKKLEVSTYSRMNIGFEAIFLYLGALCLCLWLIWYDYSCKLGCAGTYDEVTKAECVEWYSETWWT